jgi:hypothetical protein
MGVYQLPLEKLQELTKLDFGNVIDTASVAKRINGGVEQGSISMAFPCRDFHNAPHD